MGSYHLMRCTFFSLLISAWISLFSIFSPTHLYANSSSSQISLCTQLLLLDLDLPSTFPELYNPFFLTSKLGIPIHYTDGFINSAVHFLMLLKSNEPASFRGFKKYISETHIDAQDVAQINARIKYLTGKLKNTRKEKDRSLIQQELTKLIQEKKRLNPREDIVYSWLSRIKRFWILTHILGIPSNLIFPPNDEIPSTPQPVPTSISVCCILEC